MAKRVTALPLQGQNISGCKTGRGGRSWALAAARGRDVPGFEVAVQFGWSYAWRMTNDGAGTNWLLSQGEESSRIFQVNPREPLHTHCLSCD